MKPLEQRHPPQRAAKVTDQNQYHAGSDLPDYVPCPEKFIFVDKTNGTECFEIAASTDGSLASEKAANILAMHCLGRWRNPEDFKVMVPADEAFLTALAARARALIASCTLTFPTIHLTARQKDVLKEVLQQRSNKEIAADLHVSERTAKFHVSMLLQKFNVQNRMRLIQQASDGLRLNTDQAPGWAASPASPSTSCPVPALQVVSTFARASGDSAACGPLKYSRDKQPVALGRAGDTRRRGG